MNRKRLIILIEIALLSAIGFIFGKIEFSAFWLQGGGISLVMIPLALLSIRRGIAAGMIGGAIVGLLSMIFGGYIVYPLQAILDYPLAFGLLGLAGIFAAKRSNAYNMAGIALAGGLRLLSHTISGVLFFSEYAEGQNVWLYSIGYNAAYIIPEIIIGCVAIALFSLRAKELLLMGKEKAL